MKLATNMVEMKQNFRSNDKYLSQDDSNVYENLFKSQMRRLALDIEDSQIEYDSFYITGQSGNGKSTALNNLKNTNDYIKDNFITKHLMANEVFDFQDKITIVDVLLMIGMKLCESDEDIQSKYIEKLEEFKDISTKKAQKSMIKTSTTESDTSKNTKTGIDIGFLETFEIGGSFNKNWNDSEQVRNEFRQLFMLDRVELVGFINDIIREINNKNNSKKLFLILDDLEKKNISDELFTIHRELLENIELTKIITIPVNHTVLLSNIYKLNIRIKSNPLKTVNASEEKEEIEQNKTTLKNIIYKRIHKDYYGLLPDDDKVIGKLIEYSGCNIRQLIKLVGEASSNARYNDSDSISEIDVDKAIETLVNNIAIAVPYRLSFLKYIQKHHIQNEEQQENFKESIADNMIFAYFNGSPWYEVNPVIENYVNSIGND